MISREETIKLIEELRLYSHGMLRMSMTACANDYQLAATVIEELQALCDEKDATIDELRNQLETEAHEKSYKEQRGFEQDGEVLAYASKVSKTDASVMCGPITWGEAEEAERVWQACPSNSLESYRLSLESFARSRGVL